MLHAPRGTRNPRGSVSRVGWTVGAGRAHFPAWDCGPAFRAEQLCGTFTFLSIRSAWRSDIVNMAFRCESGCRVKCLDPRGRHSFRTRSMGRLAPRSSHGSERPRSLSLRLSTRKLRRRHGRCLYRKKKCGFQVEQRASSPPNVMKRITKKERKFMVLLRNV